MKNYKKILQKYKLKSIDEQRVNKKEILLAIESFFKSKPTIKEFEENMDGIVLFPETLYLLKYLR